MILKATLQKTSQILNILLDSTERSKINTKEIKLDNENDDSCEDNVDENENCEEITRGDNKRETSESETNSRQADPRKKVAKIIVTVENKDRMNAEIDTSQKKCEIISNKIKEEEEDSKNSDSEKENNLEHEEEYRISKIKNETNDSSNFVSQKKVTLVITKNETKLETSSTINEGKPKALDSDNGDSMLKFPTMHSRMELTDMPLSLQYFLCPVCKKEFPVAFLLKQHATSHKILHRYFNKGLRIRGRSKFLANPRPNTTIFQRNEILHKCIFCKEEIPVENFRDHIEDHFEKGQFPCTKCTRVFQKLSHRKAHMTLVHVEPSSPYQCDECDKGFGNKYFYECHLLTHKKPVEELPHRCEYCDKGFANKILLDRHTYRHINSKSYLLAQQSIKCTICRKTFETADDHREHRKSPCKPYTKIPPNKKGFWECDVCQKSFDKYPSFKVHKSNHESPMKYGKFLCEICGSVVVSIKQHLLSHAPKQDPLQCQICDKKLSRKLTLIRHLRVHTGERSYPCRYCGKRFRVGYGRTVHERIHKGIKKHVCAICHKGFLERSYLRKHIEAVHKNCETFIPMQKGGRPRKMGND